MMQGNVGTLRVREQSGEEIALVGLIRVLAYNTY
jgi:hypothetical protein